MDRFNQIIQAFLPGMDGDEDGQNSEEEALLDHEDARSESSSDESMEEEQQQQQQAEGQLGDDVDDVSPGACGEAREDRVAKKRRKKESKRNKTQAFDVSLPAQHLYLGELDEEGRANLEDEETTPTLSLLCISKRVLFPEETLPMHIYNPHMIQMLRSASTKQKPIAICTDLRHREMYGHRPTQEELAPYGTTAEIVAFREDESEYFYGPCFVVKFHGKQRFKLLEVFRMANGLMEGRVKILPEHHLPPRPHELFTCPPHVFTGCHATQLVARQPDCTRETRERLEQCRQRIQSPRLSNTLCPIPSWVFKFYDTDYLREKLMMEQELKTFEKEGTDSARLPQDAQSLSYWLARRLPIDDPSKLQLLSIHCPTQRLLRGLQILKEFTDLCCVGCTSVITHKEDMFSMSVDGPLAAYVNPGGHVHDTLTVTSATNLRKYGSATTEHSWFPGYKWTIMNCRTCGEHKGWLFEATKRKMIPNKFYGLRRPALQLKTACTAAGSQDTSK